jgi:hypothetical protein
MHHCHRSGKKKKRSSRPPTPEIIWGTSPVPTRLTAKCARKEGSIAARGVERWVSCVFGIGQICNLIASLAVEKIACAVALFIVNAYTNASYGCFSVWSKDRVFFSARKFFNFSSHDLPLFKFALLSAKLMSVLRVSGIVVISVFAGEFSCLIRAEELK